MQATLSTAHWVVLKYKCLPLSIEYFEYQFKSAEYFELGVHSEITGCKNLIYLQEIC